MFFYRTIFRSFGPKPLGQMFASVVIGGLAGFEMREKIPEVNPVGLTVGCAALGLIGSACLLSRDFRVARIEAGLAKRRGVLFWVVAIPAILIGLIGAMVALAMILDYFHVHRI